MNTGRDFLTPRDLAENGLNPWTDSTRRIAEVLGIGEKAARSLRRLAQQGDAPQIHEADKRPAFEALRTGLADAFTRELGLTSEQATTAAEKLR